MRTLLALLGVGVLGLGVVRHVAAPVPYRHVVLMERDLFQQLGRIADTATVEHVRCLYGSTRPDTVALDLAVEPVVEEATTLLVRAEPCPGVALASWHVHLRGVTTTGEIRSDWDPRASCYLSGTDLRAAHQYSEPPIMFVQVTPEVLCFWYKEQALAAGVQQVLPSYAEQRLGFGD